MNAGSSVLRMPSVHRWPCRPSRLVHLSAAAGGYRHLATATDPIAEPSSLTGAFTTAGQTRRSNSACYPLTDTASLKRPQYPAQSLRAQWLSPVLTSFAQAAQRTGIKTLGSPDSQGWARQRVSQHGLGTSRHARGELGGPSLGPPLLALRASSSPQAGEAVAQAEEAVGREISIQHFLDCDSFTIFAHVPEALVPINDLFFANIRFSATASLILYRR